MAAEHGHKSPTLHVHAVQLDGSTQLLVRGELDIASAPEIRKASCDLVAALAPGTRLVVDLGGLSFIDAAGLSAIVRLSNRVRAAGGTLRIEAVPPSIRRVFGLAGLELLLRLEELDSGARAAVARPVARHRRATVRSDLNA